MDRKDIAVLFSGGLDSFCMYYKYKNAGHNVIPIYFHLGLPENDKELKYMKSLDLYKDLIVNYNFKLADWKLDNEVLPFRNVHLVLGGFHYAPRVALGATASSTNRDKRSEFAGKLLDLAKFISFEPNKNPKGLRFVDMEILLPFEHKTKTEFIREYLKTGSANELLKTRSCYKGEEEECGKCASCMRKFVALTNNNLPVRMTHKITKEELEVEEARAEAVGHHQVAVDTRKCITKLFIR